MLKSIDFADDTTLYLDINLSTDQTSLKNPEIAQVQTWININNLIDSNFPQPKALLF